MPGHLSRGWEPPALPLKAAAMCWQGVGREQGGRGALQGAAPQPYLVKELERSPMKAMAAPVAAVVLQPSRSVKMLTMGEQKKIIPMAREPTHAGEREEKGDGQGGTSHRGSGESAREQVQL